MLGTESICEWIFELNVHSFNIKSDIAIMMIIIGKLNIK